MTIDQASRRKAMARWHRRLALFIAVWLVVLAVSGMLINHAHDLGLDRTPLPGPLQGVVYGIESSGDDFCGALGSEGVDCAGVFASLRLPKGSLLLSRESLFLVNDSGQLIEKMITSQLGLGSLRAGFSDGSRVYLRDGQNTVLTDADLMDAVVLDARAAQALDGRDWRVQGQAMDSISWERLLLDLHAARFLGSFATWFNDLMAGLILVLALSGVWLFRLKRNGCGNGQSGKDP